MKFPLLTQWLNGAALVFITIGIIDFYFAAPLIKENHTNDITHYWKPKNGALQLALIYGQ